MATFYVSKAGDNLNPGTEGSPVLTIGQAVVLVNASVTGGTAANTVSIGDGTYTETVTYSGSNITYKSTSSDRSLVIVTQSSGRTFNFAKGTTANTIQHITVQNTDNTGNDAGIYGANGGSGNYGSYIIEDCIFDCKPQAIVYAYASKFRRTKFLVNAADTGADVIAINAGKGAEGATLDFESCLFVGWDARAVVSSTGYAIVRNCTFVLADSTRSTSYLLRLDGTNNEIYNTIAYGGTSDVDWGIRVTAGATQTIKNCISFGATSDPYFGEDGDTVSAQLEDNTHVATDGNSIFTAVGNALVDDDYTIDSSGLAYQRGLADELPSHGKDVDGNSFDASTPNIGCYATTGWSAGSYVTTVAAASITNVLGVTSATISKVNDV